MSPPYLTLSPSSLCFSPPILLSVHIGDIWGHSEMDNCVKGKSREHEIKPGWLEPWPWAFQLQNYEERNFYCVDHTAYDMLLLHTITNTNRNLLKSLGFDFAGALSILIDGIQMNLTDFLKIIIWQWCRK